MSFAQERKKKPEKAAHSSGDGMGGLDESSRSVSRRLAHFDEDAVERRLVTDLTGKQGRALSLMRNYEVLKPILPEGVQMSLHTNDVSHALVLRSDCCSSL